MDKVVLSMIELWEGSESVRENLTWDDDGKKVETKLSSIKTDAAAGTNKLSAVIVAAPATAIADRMECKALKMVLSIFLESGWLKNALLYEGICY